MAERKPKFLRALSQALGLPETVTDQDVVPQVTQAEAFEGVKHGRRKALEQSVKGGRFGKRTFPTATAVGYATPRYQDAGEIIQGVRTSDRRNAEPFFRNPETGLVDRDSGLIYESVPARFPNVPPPPNAFPGYVDFRRVNEGPLDETVGRPAGPQPRPRPKKEQSFLQKLIQSILKR